MTPSVSRDRSREQGAALVLCMLLVLVGGVLTFSSLDIARIQVVSARHAENELRARHAAESGIQLAIARLADARDLASVANPWAGIESLDTEERAPGMLHVAIENPTRMTDERWQAMLNNKFKYRERQILCIRLK